MRNRTSSVFVSRAPRLVRHSFLAILLASASLLSAQEFRGLILGRVTDPSGAVIPGATITAKGAQTPYSTKTNSGGDFTIPFVIPGAYDVSAEAPGFKKHVQQVTIDVSQKVNLNFVLQVGTVNEEVTVQSDLVGVNTADASGGTVMDPEKVQNLPLNGRQVYMLMTLTPGVLFTTTAFGPSGNSGTRGWDQTNAYQINGVVNNQNQFELNGAPISQQTSTARGAWFIAPNVDAVQEFKVQTTNYDATIGRSGGGTINVVTKQGTNRFHGTVFDYWRNSIMDANFWQFDQIGQKKGFHNQHQFGGTVGGPIKHGKTYFFGSFEGWREMLPIPAINTVPSGIVQNPDGSVDMSAYLKGINPNSGGIYNPFACATTNPDGSCATRQRLSWQGKNDVVPPSLVSSIGLKILALYPAPNQPGFRNNFIASTGGRYRYNQPIIRIDHNFTDKTKLYGMYSWWSGTEFRNTQGFPNLAVVQGGNINNYRSFQSQILDLTHTFSGTLVGDIRASLGRAKDRSPNGGLAAGIGKLTPADLGLTTFPIPPTTDQNFAPEINNGDPPANLIGNSQFNDTGHPPLNVTYEVSPSITQTKGRHNLRYGGQFMQIYAIPCCGSGSSGGFGASGDFTFNGDFTRFNPNNANTNPAGNCPAGVTCATGSGIAGLVMGIPTSGRIPWNLPIYEGYPYYAVYFQDDWKVRPNLTLNLGLRYDFELSPDERYNRLNGGFCYTCTNPVTSLITFPANNVLTLANGTPTGLTMPNPIVGGFTYIGNGRSPYDTQFNHWGPRIGVSWGLNKKTVIRGGYGVNYGFAFELGGNTTFTQQTNYVATTGAGGTTPTTAFKSGNPYGSSDPSKALVPPSGPINGLLSSIGDGQSYDQRNRRITRVQHYSLGIQRELPGNIVLDAAYVGTYTGNIRVGTNFDALTPAQIAQCAAGATGAVNLCNQQVKNPFFHAMPANAAASTLNNSATVAAWVLMEAFPQFNQTLFSNTEPVGWSDYNSLQAKVNKRFSGGGALIKGLSFLSSFTWSKNMVANGLNNNNNGQCPGCVEFGKPLYQLDGSDRTLNFAFSGIYGLPIGKGGVVASNASGILGQLLNDWSMEWIYTQASGTPVGLSNTVTFNCPQNNNNYLPAHRTFNEWLYNESPSCFTTLPNNTWIPRPAVPRSNIIRNYYVPQMQFGITKLFAVREGINLQFKAEAFNALNTPLFGGVNTGSQTSTTQPVFFTDPKTGQRTQIQPGQPGAFTGYGTIGSTEQNFPRQIQLSLKVLF